MCRGQIHLTILQLQLEYPGLLVCMCVVSTYCVLQTYFITCADLTPPIVRLTSFPPAVARQTEWLFRFLCVNEFRCTFVCSVHVVGNLSRFADCNDGQWLTTMLQNDVQYEFAASAIDAVGNAGHVVTYQWTVGEFCENDIILYYNYHELH